MDLSLYGYSLGSGRRPTGAAKEHQRGDGGMSEHDRHQARGGEFKAVDDKEGRGAALSATEVGGNGDVASDSHVRYHKS